MLAVVLTDSDSIWRRIISVGNLVQSPSCRGNGMPVIPSKTELFPADWSPHTTSCGKATKSPTPWALIFSIWFKRWLDLTLRRWLKLPPAASVPLCADAVIASWDLVIFWAVGLSDALIERGLSMLCLWICVNDGSSDRRRSKGNHTL